jgi:hypothetical protein
VTQYLKEFDAAISNDLIDSEVKLLKDLNYLKTHTQQVESILSKYEIMGKFGPKGHGKFVVIDSYTHRDENSASFLIDKLSLQFNLACAYSRMPSRMELSWDKNTMDEKGSI